MLGLRFPEPFESLVVGLSGMCLAPYSHALIPFPSRSQ